MTSENLDRTKSVVIVIDKQIGYTADNQAISKILPSKTNTFTALLPRLDGFIKYCRSVGMEVVWTKMIESTDFSPNNIRLKMKSSNTPTITDPNSESFEINGLGPLDGEKIITKQYYDAFAQTELDGYLKSKGIYNVILVGGFGSRCVLGTSYGANGNNYNVIVLNDLIENPSRLSHELPVALGIIDSILGYVIPSKELDDLIEKLHAFERELINQE